MAHELKMPPHWFQAVVVGTQRATVLRDDPRYHVGDTLLLREWDGTYTGRRCTAIVTHVVRHEEVPDLLSPGVAVLSFQRLDDVGTPVPRDPVAGETGAVLAALHEVRDAVVQQTARLETWGRIVEGILRDQTGALKHVAHHVARLDPGGGPRTGGDEAGPRGTPLGPWWKRLW